MAKAETQYILDQQADEKAHTDWEKETETIQEAIQNQLEADYKKSPLILTTPVQDFRRYVINASPVPFHELEDVKTSNFSALKHYVQDKDDQEHVNCEAFLRFKDTPDAYPILEKQQTKKKDTGVLYTPEMPLEPTVEALKSVGCKNTEARDNGLKTCIVVKTSKNNQHEADVTKKQQIGEALD
ncbi:UNVERIFIED_CONTAM: hypothetical protein HDU68_005638, partial [Siphonaria sp. JEL0065]